MALHLLDTTTFSLLMREDPIAVARLQSLAADESVAVCTIVRGEIEHGLARLDMGEKKDRLVEKAANLFAAIPCEAVREEAARHYGRIKRAAERRGTPLDENDLWIAATALDLGAILATSDTDFGRIEELDLEDWGTPT